MSIAYKKNGVWVTASGTPPIDDALSATSENAVQNKIVKQAVDGVDTNTDIVQAQVANSGDAYDPTRPYKVGELCIYNNVLYRCTTACSAGSWSTNQSCFTADTLVNINNTQSELIADSVTMISQNGLYTQPVYFEKVGRTVTVRMIGDGTISHASHVTIPSAFVPPDGKLVCGAADVRDPAEGHLLGEFNISGSTGQMFVFIENASSGEYNCYMNATYFV